MKYIQTFGVANDSLRSPSHCRTRRRELSGSVRVTCVILVILKGTEQACRDNVSKTAKRLRQQIVREIRSFHFNLPFKIDHKTVFNRGNPLYNPSTLLSF